jgi:DNA-binding response OmpR family regulator
MRVIVVEDEPTVALGVRLALEDEGHHVDVFDNGRDGLHRLVTEPYALAILDIMLPGVNGYEICRTARAHGFDGPILMLSAKSGEWDVAEGLDLGADDYLTKPFSTVELLARVRARTRGGHGANRFRVGELRLDPSARRCWRGEYEIALTRREADLLTALFEADGEVVTKEDLLDLAWGGHHRGDANVVEVYVGRLRRKLARLDLHAYIETVRGMGYQLRVPTVGVTEP